MIERFCPSMVFCVFDSDTVGGSRYTKMAIKSVIKVTNLAQLHNDNHCFRFYKKIVDLYIILTLTFNFKSYCVFLDVSRDKIKYTGISHACVGETDGQIRNIYSTGESSVPGSRFWETLLTNECT